MDFYDDSLYSNKDSDYGMARDYERKTRSSIIIELCRFMYVVALFLSALGFPVNAYCLFLSRELMMSRI